MPLSKFSNLRVPDRYRLVDGNGFIDINWRDYFYLIVDLLTPLGVEKFVELNNNQVEVADVTGLKVSKLKVSVAIVEYLIQRVTTNTNPVELIESGAFHLVYRPTQDTWELVPIGTPGPDSSGVTLTVTSDGQVQYVSTLVDGTASISKIHYRMRTMSGKNTQYSAVG